MKKHLLAVLLTLVLVFCFSSAALAASEATIYDLTVEGYSTGEIYLDREDYHRDETVKLTTAGDTRLELSWDVDKGYLVELDGDLIDESSERVSLSSRGVTKIEIRVYNETDKEDEITVTLQVEMEKAQLTGLDIYGYNDDTEYLDSQDFEADKTSYSLKLDNGEEGVYLTPYWDDDDDLRVEVSVPNSYADDVEIEEEDDDTWVVYFDHDTPDEIYVTISGGGYAEGVYTLSLSQARAGELLGLSVSEGDEYHDRDAVDLLPKFDEDVTDYAVLLPADVDNYFSVQFELEDNDNYLVVDGKELRIDRNNLAELSRQRIAEGGRVDIEFTVGETDYTLTVFRADEDGDDDSSLDDLRLQTRQGTSSSAQNTALTMSPSFRSNTERYAVEETTADTLYLYAEPSDRNAIVFVNDVLLRDSYFELKTKNLERIEVTVYAENLEDSTTYTLLFGEVAANNGALGDLKLYDTGYSGITLSPGFNSEKSNYTACVGNAIRSFYIYATAAEKDSTIAIAQNGGNYVTKTANAAAYNLDAGLNVFDIRVTTEYGDVSHYYLNAYRQSTSPRIVVSSQKLSIDGGNATAIAAYNIDGNNFLKLRDVAYLLNGTTKSFSVSYSQNTNLISLQSGGRYTAVGNELEIPGSYDKYTVSPQAIRLDSGYIYPAAYNIDGSNYFLLRDLAALFDFAIGYSSGTVTINTGASYSY